MARIRALNWSPIGRLRLGLAWAAWLWIVPPAIMLTLAGIPARLRDLRANIPAHAAPEQTPRGAEYNERSAGA